MSINLRPQNVLIGILVKFKFVATLKNEIDQSGSAWGKPVPGGTVMGAGEGGTTSATLRPVPTRQSEDRCCWTCQKCSANQYLNASSNYCETCDRCQRPDYDRGGCVAKHIVFFEFKNQWAITSMVFATLGKRRKGRVEEIGNTGVMSGPKTFSVDFS